MAVRATATLGDGERLRASSHDHRSRAEGSRGGWGDWESGRRRLGLEGRAWQSDTAGKFMTNMRTLLLV